MAACDHLESRRLQDDSRRVPPGPWSHFDSSHCHRRGGLRVGYDENSQDIFKETFGSQDLAVNCRPNLFTLHSLKETRFAYYGLGALYRRYTHTFVVRCVSRFAYYGLGALYRRYTHTFVVRCVSRFAYYGLGALYRRYTHTFVVRCVSRFAYYGLGALYRRYTHTFVVRCVSRFAYYGLGALYRRYTHTFVVRCVSRFAYYGLGALYRRYTHTFVVTKTDNHNNSRRSTGSARRQRAPTCTRNTSGDRYDENTALLARRSDEALEVRVSVARIAPSLLDLTRGGPTGVHPALNVQNMRQRTAFTFATGPLGFAALRFVSGSTLHLEPTIFLSLILEDTGPELLHLVMSCSRAQRLSKTSFKDLGSLCCVALELFTPMSGFDVSQCGADRVGQRVGACRHAPAALYTVRLADIHECLLPPSWLPSSPHQSVPRQRSVSEVRDQAPRSLQRPQCKRPSNPGGTRLMLQAITARVFWCRDEPAGALSAVRLSPVEVRSSYVHRLKTRERTTKIALEFPQGLSAAELRDQLAVISKQWLDYSPPIYANRVRFPVGQLPDFCMRESCRTMPLVDEFSRGSLASPVLAFRRCSILTSRLSRPRAFIRAFGDVSRLTFNKRLLTCWRRKGVDNCVSRSVLAPPRTAQAVWPSSRVSSAAAPKYFTPERPLPQLLSLDYSVSLGSECNVLSTEIIQREERWNKKIHATRYKTGVSVVGPWGDTSKFDTIARLQRLHWCIIDCISRFQDYKLFVNGVSASQIPSSQVFFSFHQYLTLPLRRFRQENNVVQSLIKTSVCIWHGERLGRLLTTRSCESMRLKRGDCEAAPECKGGGNGRSLSKPADRWHRPARFPHAKIREQMLVCMAAVIPLPKVCTISRSCFLAAGPNIDFVLALYSSPLKFIAKGLTGVFAQSGPPPDFGNDTVGLETEKYKATLEARVSVARIAPSLLDLGRGVHPTVTENSITNRLPPRRTGFAPGFSHVGIKPDDTAGRRVSSEISCFTRPYILALLPPRLWRRFSQCPLPFALICRVLPCRPFLFRGVSVVTISAIAPNNPVIAVMHATLSNIINPT
ncbi:hypothetical protein PR048_002934 [Dryococelus australis]|uniref:Uncharacterized protein n=1 Tax=Dryococelus australis TaxID=614101 RepID=A0ABQ9ILK0_9NEOP|nr:hypothetical protein PR048_002934 [Dryococelus australis]